MSAQSPAGDRTEICCAVAPQAAQALEPAALIPLPLLSPVGRVVLVGDPAQLPATVLSKAAAAANLAQSLFERLQRVRVLGCSIQEQQCSVASWRDDRCPRMLVQTA